MQVPHFLMPGQSEVMLGKCPGVATPLPLSKDHPRGNV